MRLADPDVVAVRDLTTDITTWLDRLAVAQAESAEELRWLPGWHRPGTPVRSAEHLSTLITTLDDEEFGGVAGPIEGRWVQTMRVGSRWIVEVSHETGNWPRRVYVGDVTTLPSRAKRDTYPSADELMRPLVVADIAWTWMKLGVLPPYFSSTDDFRCSGR